MLRFASALPALFLLCFAATALAPTESVAQRQESFRALEAGYMVQQAVDAGLDAERAGRMRDILVDIAVRFEILDRDSQGKIVTDEMRARERKIREDRDEKLKALLGGKIHGVLDWGKAASRATRVVQARPSKHPYLTGETILSYCVRHPDMRTRSGCRGYIRAVVDSGLASGPGGRRARQICVPAYVFMVRGDPLDIILGVVIQHLRKSPAARAKVGFEAAAEALAAAYPC